MKIAVVGLGYWGSKVFDEYATLRDEGVIDSVVACDIDRSRLEDADRADDTARSVESIIDEVDGLHVCTGNTSHFGIAKQAIEAETDILVEKPLTVDHNDAYDLVEMASANGRILQTGHIFRFANVVREVRDLYDDDHFGGVNAITLRWTHDIEPLADTNVLWDLLPHPVDILNFITGDWPTEITVMGSKSAATDSYEQATIGATVDDVQTSIQVSWADHVRRRSLEIAGEERSAVVDCVDQTIEMHEPDGSTELREVTDNNTIKAEANNFVSAIDSGENKFNSAIVGARTVDVIGEIEETLDDGR